ncbi:hypothetical protein UFOVP1339_55 [uncultured Caudovirales phage]|uniref:Uncharacterized protein n=1 Tax=uncultured Caudovirales phage TaxID=2100421 RepID=A0A6J5S4F2_9CAUD|nr:hypothetical protein UFOVP1339_55 [uncultured Caudovirales phage]
MESYSVTATTPERIAGVTAARLAYNADLDEGGVPFDKNEGYIQFVMNGAMDSYALKYGVQK